MHMNMLHHDAVTIYEFSVLLLKSMRRSCTRQGDLLYTAVGKIYIGRRESFHTI